MMIKWRQLGTTLNVPSFHFEVFHCVKFLKVVHWIRELQLTIESDLKIVSKSCNKNGDIIV
jgi:hypothetical protein